MVTLCEHTPESTGKLGGRGPKLWAFGYEALAKLFGMTEGAVRQAVYDGRLDPADLEMVCESWMRFHPSKARSFISDLDWREDQARMAKTPEEREVLAAVRAAREARRAEPPPDPVEEARRMVERCKEAPITRTGPTPADLDYHARLDMNDPEVRGMVLAKCAAGEHHEYIITRAIVGKGHVPEPQNEAESITEYAERLLVAGGFPPEAARAMAQARRGGPHGPGKEVDLPDPDIPF